MFKRISSFLVPVLAVASPALAVDTTIADLFTAVSISTVAGSVGTLLLAFLAIRVLFLGYKYIKRTMGAA